MTYAFLAKKLVAVADEIAVFAEEMAAAAQMWMRR
jgi:hypothetical protein